MRVGFSSGVLGMVLHGVAVVGGGCGSDEPQTQGTVPDAGPGDGDGDGTTVDGGPDSGSLSTALPVDAETGCADGTAACNGFCLEEGQRANGCTFVFDGQANAVTARPGEVLIATNAGLVVLEAGSWQARSVPKGPTSGLLVADKGKVYVASGLLQVFDEATNSFVELHDTGSSFAEITQLRVAGDHLYFIEEGSMNPGLKRMPAAGGAVEELVPRATGYALADGQLVYRVSGTLSHAALSSPSNATELVKNVSTPWFSIHQGFVYWREPSELTRVSLGGGDSEVAASLRESELIGEAAGVMFHSDVSWFNQANDLRAGRVSRAQLGESATVEVIYEGLGFPKTALELDGQAIVHTDDGVFAIDL